jgi:1-acyl-sn-glycerol-3-phosphate acyltransferase
MYVEKRGQFRGVGKRQTYVWRLFATGACFVLFGLGGLVLGLLVFPLMLLWPSSPELRRARIRSSVQRAFRLFVEVMRVVGVLRYEFVGSERLGRPGQLIIANHPTLIDVVFIIAFTSAPTCVVKTALFTSPFTRHVVRAAGYLRNTPTDKMIAYSVSALQAGDSLVMFPEGARTRVGQPLLFHRGASRVAVEGASVLTPIFIRVDQLLLNKSYPWYRIPPKIPNFSIVVGEDIDLAPFRSVPIPRGSRCLNDRLIEIYEKHLA